ncbi:uncharacterized protein LOC129879921 [Solanum dulcamara]|uniref:uncharacterized protein LOC129879921 n=1 Tax=Solanum dulcamara TaxID=45834 RepID=UPI0024854EED|nr:uncharacterized protein LOC129879921 [Solanum dulcamara]
MDTQPFSGGPITAATAAVTPSGTVNYADSADSSPGSHHTDSWDDQHPPSHTAAAVTGTGGKLRLMCSYGGHIFPRPHDKTLCYVGGDTRIFVANRNTSLTELSDRLSKTLLGGQPFCLKYQLQNEDLDSLISVTSDEDLENMIDEYDRMSSSSKISRLRLFLFPSKIDSWNPSIGGLIRDSSVKSEDWFVNILNGANNSTASTKVFSESSSVNCLLGLDDDLGNANFKEVEPQLDMKNRGNNVKVNIHDVQSVPDSPMVETTSSFGSGSSMPSLANLPPIRVHVEENQKGGGIEEQFSQMTVGVKQKNEEGGFLGLASSPAAPTVVVPATVVSGVPVVEQTLQQQQPQQLQPNPVIPSDLPSPDSVSSEGSGRQRHYFYQEPGVHFQSGSGRISGNSVDLNMSDSIGRVQVKQQVQDGGGGYALPVQYDQHPQMLQPQQYVHAGQYIQRTPSGHVPVTSYYPMYPSQHQTHMQHPNLEHQYPVYFIPARPGQGYSLPLQQTNYTEPAQTVPPTCSQTPPTMVNPSAAYNPPRNPPSSNPEMVAGTYRTLAAAAPQLVQITPGQHQPQYMNYSQIHYPSQSIRPTSATTANYAYDFADPAHAKMYYSQPLAPQLAAQYQTMTSAPAVSFTETSSQLPVENSKQQIRTSQA